MNCSNKTCLSALENVILIGDVEVAGETSRVTLEASIGSHVLSSTNMLPPVNERRTPVEVNIPHVWNSPPVSVISAESEKKSIGAPLRILRIWIGSLLYVPSIAHWRSPPVDVEDICGIGA